MKKVHVCIGLVLLIFIVSLAGCNQTEDENLTVEGVIYFENEPLENVEILKNGSSFNPQIITDNAGRFCIDKINAGDKLTFLKDGFTFNSYECKNSISDVLIIAKRKTAKVKTIFDKSLGNVTGEGEYNLGDKVVLSAVPNDYIKFLGFYFNNKLLTNENIFNFTVKKDIHIEALFEKIKYPLDIKNIPEGIKVKGTGKYSIGDTVNLQAESNQNYLFLNWVINGEIVNDLCTEFQFKNIVNTISVNFKKRISATKSQYTNQILSWENVENAESYDIFLNDEFLISTNDNFINFYDILFKSGNYCISIIAKSDSENFADSIKSNINIVYYRPINSPKIAFFNDEKNKDVYLVIDEINGALNYNVFINDESFLLGKNFEQSKMYLDYIKKDGQIFVNLNSIFKEPINYKIYVVACAREDCFNSLPSNKILYENIVIIKPPDAKITGSILTWTHSNPDAKFNIKINGVNIDCDTSKKIDLNKYCMCENNEIIIEVYAKGYRKNKIVLEYKRSNYEE